MAVGDLGINLMTNAGMRSALATITYSGTSMSSYYENMWNGGKALNASDGTYTHSRSFGGGVSVSQTFKVTFASPVYVLSWGAYGLHGWGDNGVPEGGDSGYTQVYLDTGAGQVLVYSTGEQTGSGSYEDETPKLVTSIEIRVGGSQIGGDWWSECACCMSELEIYISDEGYGAMI